MTPGKKIFITRRLPSIARELLSQHCDVDESPRNEPYPADGLAALMADYDAVLSTVTERFDEQVLEHRSRLEVISNYAVGLNNIDVPYARSLGITVYNTPDVVTNSTADLTFAILLSLIRQIPHAQEFVRQGRWKGWDPELFLGEELSGKIFGILGFGRIGKAVARRAGGFGLESICYNAVTAGPDTPGGARAVSLDELLETSDYLSIHLPLTADTHGLVDKRLFGKMCKRPIVLNMARGEIVVTEDLVDALRVGQIRGAGLDVLASEQVSAGHPLCEAGNVVLVPHIGTATVDCRRNMAALAAMNILNHFR